MANDIEKTNRNLETPNHPIVEAPIGKDPIHGSEKMYQNIEESLTAMHTVTIDGYTAKPLPVSLVANSFKKYLPDSETSMLLSRALPLSQADLEAIRMKDKYTKSMQYRLEQCRLTSLTLDETTGPRLRVAYRLCRLLSLMQGLGSSGVPLSLMLGTACPEINLFDIPRRFDPFKGYGRGMAAPRKLLQEITESQYRYTFMIDGSLYMSQGMSILPPPLPDQYLSGTPHIDRREGAYPANYDPRSDVPLSFYLNIMEFLANHLEIGGGDLGIGGGFKGIQKGIDTGTESMKNVTSINTDDKGALLALLNPNIARLSWPCRDDIETFEETVLLPYIEDIMVENPQIDAENLLKEEMGLTRTEAVDYIEMAKTYAQNVHTYDPDRERSPMISRINRLAQKCDDAGMVTTQLNSFKQVCQILGLTKHDDDITVDKRAGLRNELEAKFKEEKILAQAEPQEPDSPE